jgi:hypothetical protein
LDVDVNVGMTSERIHWISLDSLRRSPRCSPIPACMAFWLIQWREIGVRCCSSFFGVVAGLPLALASIGIIRTLLFGLTPTAHFAGERLDARAGCLLCYRASNLESDSR